MPDETAAPEQPEQHDEATPAAPDASTPRSAEPQWQRRKRLEAVFGDVLPETTSDEREPDAGDGDDSGDRWLRAQVPPHHG